MSKRQVKVYPRFERLWHWSQVLSILILLFTGLGMNGLHHVIPFGPAVMIHTIAALALLALWIFTTFLAVHHRHLAPVRAHLGRVGRGCQILCRWCL